MEGLKLKENEVVHCKTEKQANKVLKIAYKLGCEWQVQSLGNRFYDCKENTVYHLDNIITYSNLEYCKGKELKVITAKEFLKRHKEPKKGKLTIIVSKNYKELFKDAIGLPYNFLLIHSLENTEWIKDVLKECFNITLYTDKNDPELFKKSFDNFEVKLIDTDVSTSPLGKEGIVRKEELVSGWYYNLYDSKRVWLMYYDFESGKRFGFHSNGKWHTDNESNDHKEFLIKADINEVEERLKEEAVKRGFKEGVKIDRSNFDTRLGVETIADRYTDDVGVKLYEDEEHGVYVEYDGYVIMNNGIWAKILEEKLTLENIQVDCSELTTEQIEEMKRVVVENGFELWNSLLAFKITEDYNFFRVNIKTTQFAIYDLDENKTTITYDKFMELFDTKKEECNNNLKGLVLVSHKGVDKIRLQEPEYVEQMIKEGKILHAENFNKSLIMDNGNTISNVKEGEVKSIEELHVEHRDQNSTGKPYNKKHLHLEEPVFNPQSHYNNEFGSLYKMSEKLGLNTYEFDILKRVVRCRKKGQFEEDLQKTKDLIDLYLIESKK